MHSPTPHRTGSSEASGRDECRRAGDVETAVIVVNYRTPGLSAACLAALRHEKEAINRLRVILVDGGSNDGSAAELSELVARCDYKGWVSFLPLELNGGFGWANNQAILE